MDHATLVSKANQKLIKTLDPAKRANKISRDPVLLAHQRDYFREQIWPQGLDALIEAQFEDAPPKLPAGHGDLDKARKLAAKEKNIPGIKLVGRRYLEGRGWCSLQELTDNIHHPDESNFSAYRRSIKRMLFPVFEPLGIWSIDGEKSYKIAAGPLLIVFLNDIYPHWRAVQDKWFRENRPEV